MKNKIDDAKQLEEDENEHETKLIQQELDEEYNNNSKFIEDDVLQSNDMDYVMELNEEEEKERDFSIRQHVKYDVFAHLPKQIEIVKESDFDRFDDVQDRAFPLDNVLTDEQEQVLEFKKLNDNQSNGRISFWNCFIN
jgi:hypothetical protein